MPIAEFIFKLIDQTGGGTGAGGAPSGNPQASPQPGRRTQVREETEAQGGGAGRALQETQERQGVKRRRLTFAEKQFRKPIVNAKIVRSQLSQQGEIFGTALAKRFGFGGVVQAAGTAAAPLAAVGAVAGVAFAQFKAAQAINRQQIKLARQLRPFSPSLAVSQARESVRDISTNLDLARRFGPSLAESERQRGRFGAAATEFGAQISTGILGQELSASIELLARGLEVNNRLMTFIAGAIPKGPATIGNKILDALGIAEDKFKNLKAGIVPFNDFPHAPVTAWPYALDVGELRELRERGEVGSFTTDQDNLLNQI